MRAHGCWPSAGAGTGCPACTRCRRPAAREPEEGPTLAQAERTANNRASRQGSLRHPSRWLRGRTLRAVLTINMKHVYLPATALAFLANCAGGAAPTAAQTQKLAQAQALLADDKPDDALRITDELLHDQPEWRDARLCSAKGFVALSKIDRKNLPKELVLQDAATAYERALAIDDKDADSWVALAQVRYELGLYESARTAAEQAMKLFEE